MRVTLDLDVSASDRPAGRLILDGQHEPVAFDGWLDLMRVVESLLSTQGPPADPGISGSDRRNLGVCPRRHRTAGPTVLTVQTNGSGPRPAPELTSLDDGRPPHGRGWLRRTRAAAARKLWDDHYAGIAADCARSVPDMATVYAFVDEAFAQLFSRWIRLATPSVS